MTLCTHLRHEPFSFCKIWEHTKICPEETRSNSIYSFFQNERITTENSDSSSLASSFAFQYDYSVLFKPICLLMKLINELANLILADRFSEKKILR